MLAGENDFLTNIPGRNVWLDEGEAREQDHLHRHGRKLRGIDNCCILGLPLDCRSAKCRLVTQSSATSLSTDLRSSHNNGNWQRQRLARMKTPQAMLKATTMCRPMAPAQGYK